MRVKNAVGRAADLAPLIERAHAADVLVAVGADPLALALLTPPGEMGADVVYGSAQRFGVPLGYGGPHAAFFATRQGFVRQLPGRLIGVSVDAHGHTAYRMALATRDVDPHEQGRLQGAFMSLASLCGVFAPLLYAAVFAASIDPASSWHFPGAPFALASAIVALALVVSERATRPRVAV